MNQKISSFIKKNTSKLVTTATIVLLISILTGPSIVYYINNTDTKELETSILSSTNTFIEDSTEAIQLAELKKEEAMKVVEPPKCKIERIVEPIVTPDWYTKIPTDAQFQYDEHIEEKISRREYVDSLPPALQMQMVKNYEAEELQKELDLLEAPRRKEREEAAAAYYYAQQSYNYDYTYYDDSSSYEEESYEEPAPAPAPSSPDGMTYYGGKELTAYEYTGSPTASGEWPQEGYTAASNDPNLWGKDIYIEGLGTYHVHDTGGMSNNVIDIYMGDVETCIQFGRQYGEVYIID